MVDTTTDEPTVDTGAVEALPETQETTADSTNEVSSSESTNEGAETEAKAEEALPEADEGADKLASFAKGQGIEDVSELSEREQKLLKVAYDNNAEFQRNRQKATELEKTLSTASDSYAEEVAGSTGQDPELLKRVQRVEVKDAVRDFWDSNPEARSLEKEMVQELQVRPHLAGDLEALYAVVRSKNSEAVKSQVKQDTLKSLANKQQASVPSGNATSSTVSSNKITPQNVDSMVSKMSIEEYQKRLPEIQAALNA